MYNSVDYIDIYLHMKNGSCITYHRCKKIWLLNDLPLNSK